VEILRLLIKSFVLSYTSEWL